ncbi:hypothetical protein G5B30_14645 [Sphingobacterium sp. SGG-5]|uniref:DUF2683 family protein n=1 Tax=Sphingobacterium sp. SGG-5 TaxID=2710881 RepID=UPI0013ED7A6C|nr:hypothetical protein [Sphingobacterium sp. SGG-5]
MDNIIIPKNKNQSSIIQAFLKEMKIHFKIKDDETKMSQEEFFTQIDEAKQEVKEGKTTKVTKEQLHSFLESL